MKLLRSLTVGLLVAVPTSRAGAVDVDSLKQDGFSVVRTTHVTGEFEGCENGAEIGLDDGSVFVCAGSGHMYAYHPIAILLKSAASAGYKLLVNGAAYDGRLDSP